MGETRYRLVAAVLLVPVAYVLAGCSKQRTVSAEDRSTMSRAPVHTAEGNTQPHQVQPDMSSGSNEIRVTESVIATTSAVMSSVKPAATDQGQAQLDDVFFDYDKFTLRRDAESVLNLDARILKKQGGIMTIAGHCDERGTAAYNLVLGEKRARSVKRYLEDLGVPTWRLRVISYGKEKPFCQGHNSDCWQSNRRAHFSMP